MLQKNISVSILLITFNHSKNFVLAEKDPYYSRGEVSNSDLSALAKYWMPGDLVYDIEIAYRFGTLVDAMITEQDKINYYKLTCAGEVYSRKEFDLAEGMAKSFWNDPLCALLAKNSEMQKVSTEPKFRIEYNGYVFYVSARCKWDLYAKHTLGITGDIKSTTATTEKQFIAACAHFQYFRQRAWYMDIENVEKDMLIGISKVNKKVFKVPIVRGGEFYQIGKEQYQELAFKHWYLFGNIDYSMEQYKIAA